MNESSSLWETVLQSLELPSTRMLLAQQARLEGIIPGSKPCALIRVEGPWLPMVNSRADLMEEAFTKVLGAQCHVRVVAA